MKTKAIPSKWIFREGLRLDSKPYMSGALEAKAILEDLAVEKQPLEELTDGHNGGIYNGPKFSRTWVENPEHGVPFLGSSRMLLSDFSHLPLLSNKDANSSKLSYLKLEAGTTLISCSGTVGRMAYARQDMQGIWSSQHIMKVVSDPQKIKSGYLYAYLHSKFGVPQVVSGTYGAIIQHIEPHHISQLPVPRLGDEIENKVHEIIQKSSALLSTYQIRVRDATNHFFGSVELKDIEPYEWTEKGSDISFYNTIKSSSSLRALNFNPRFQELCASLKSREWKALGEICKPGTLRRGGRYKRIDAEPGFGYQILGQRQLFWLRPEGRWVAKFALDNDVFVDSGTTLIAATGTLGEHELYCRSEFVWGSMTEFAYSELFVRVVADEQVMPRGCLFAFLRSETAFRLFRSISFGSKQQYLHPDFLPNIPVPLPAKEVQEEIHDLIVSAYEDRQKALELENKAIALVEKAIEEAA